MRVRAALAGAAVLVLLGTPVSAFRTGRAQNDPKDALVAANALLDERERAFAAGDTAAWMATVDPQAPQSFKDAQARHFAGLRSLPIEGFALTARLDDTGDLAPAADRFVPETRMTYRIGGYDDRDAVDTLWLTFVERNGRWVVAADTDVADLGLDTGRGLWDFGEVRAIRSEHFLVLHHPEQAARADDLAGLAEQAIAKLDAAWDHPWSGRIPIVLPGSIDELEELLQSTIDLDKFVAFVSYSTIRDESWAPTAPRMYIQDRTLSAYSREFQIETLVHELAHAAGSAIAGPFLSAWSHEGVADWVATGRGTREAKPNGSDGVLPRDFEFTTGSQTDIIRAYRESRSVISYLAATRGRQVPTAFFAAAGAPKVAPGSIDYRLDQALRAVADTSLADLQGGWARR